MELIPNFQQSSDDRITIANGTTSVVHGDALLTLTDIMAPKLDGEAHSALPIHQRNYLLSRKACSSSNPRKLQNHLPDSLTLIVSTESSYGD